MVDAVPPIPAPYYYYSIKLFDNLSEFHFCLHSHRETLALAFTQLSSLY